MIKWDKIEDKIFNSINPNKKNVLIQAGHFSILSDKNGDLVPAIVCELNDKQLIDFVDSSNYMSDFPLKTFETGIHVASKLKDNSLNIKFTFIVNDWQWLNKGLYNYKTNRQQFYNKNKLPNCYSHQLREHKFSIDDILRVDNYVKNSIYFSEQKLRKKGKKTVRDCSPESCAIEYIPFLNESMADFDSLISFIPMSCKTPVLYSSIKYIKNCNRSIDLIHVFYDPLKKNVEFSLLNKYSISFDFEKEVDLSFQRMELMSK